MHHPVCHTLVKKAFTFLGLYEMNIFLYFLVIPEVDVESFFIVKIKSETLCCFFNFPLSTEERLIELAFILEFCPFP